MSNLFKTKLLGANISSWFQPDRKIHSSTYAHTKDSYCQESIDVPVHCYSKTSIKTTGDLDRANGPISPSQLCHDVISAIEPIVKQEDQLALRQELGSQPFFIAPQINERCGGSCYRSRVRGN